MKSEKEMIKEGIINENKNVPYSYIALFYKEQLKKFNSIGLGGFTEFGIKITPSLIEITEKRLKQLGAFRRGNNNGTV